MLSGHSCLAFLGKSQPTRASTKTSDIGPDPFAVQNVPNRAYQQPPPNDKADPIAVRSFRYSPQAQQVYESTPDFGFNPNPAAPAQPQLLMSADLSKRNAEVDKIREDFINYLDDLESPIL